MDKHYIDQILEIYKNERKQAIFFSEDHVSEIINLFDLDKCNIHALRAIRDSVVFRIDMLRRKDEENSTWYMNIISYTTSVIDKFIYNRGGEV